MTTTPSVPRFLTETQFEEEFSSIEGPDGSSIWEWEHARLRDLHHVWTVVEADDDRLYALPGFHIVNKIGYYVTERPWTSEDIDVCFDTLDDERDFPHRHEADGEGTTEPCAGLDTCERCIPIHAAWQEAWARFAAAE